MVLPALLHVFLEVHGNAGRVWVGSFAPLCADISALLVIAYFTFDYCTVRVTAPLAVVLPEVPVTVSV
jgi:hypothetical protein